MIEMAVRHHDRRGPGVGAEALFGGRADQPCGPEDAGVDEDPAAIAGPRRADEDDVDDGEPLVGEVGRKLMRAVVAHLVPLRVVGPDLPG